MNLKKKKRKPGIKQLAGISTGLMVVIMFVSSFTMLVCDKKIDNATEYLHSLDMSALPNVKAALLLGTSKHLGDGRDNLYFKNRISAALKLYESGKIKLLVISGDNGSIYYNEPMDMKKELVKLGVPDSLIYLDYAGFRTYDSVIRMNKIFGQSKFIVISQKFHNQRAIFIGRSAGFEIYGFDAEDVSAYMGFKTQVREKFARVKVFLDFIFNAQPKFLGDKIELK